jgi:hypothetical protein
MKAVRCKFTVSSITRTAHTTGYEKGPDGKDDYARPIRGELHTIEMSPVYGNGDPAHENTRFWKQSPSGSFKLGTINAEAAAAFSLHGDYYIDITPA